MTQIKSEIADGIVSGLEPGITLADAFEQARRAGAMSQLVEAWTELRAALAEEIRKLWPAVYDALRPIIIMMYRMGIYARLRRHIPEKAAWWVAERLPERLILKLPVRFMSMG